MAQILRPASDVTVNSWTDEGTTDNDGSLYTSLDESTIDNDDSYILDAGANTLCEVKLEAGSAPTAGTVTLYVYGRSIGSGGPEKLDIRLLEGTTEIAAWPNASNRSSSYAQLAGDLSQAQVDAITDWTDLRVELTGDSVGGGEELRVTQVYLQTPDAVVTQLDIDVNDSITVTENSTVSIQGPDPLSVSVADNGWYDSNWTYREKITVQSSKVDADLTDFPVYVDLSTLSSGFHTNVNQTDGRDIRITTSDGKTEIPREVVFYDSSNDTGELHFKADISSSSNTDFYIYYGNAGASDYGVSDTYGRNNVWTEYDTVLHLHEAVNTDAGGYVDSTGNGNSGQGVSMALTEVSGKLSGNAQHFDGSADYINLDTSPISTSANSVSLWFSVDGSHATQGILETTADATTLETTPYLLLQEDSGTLKIYTTVTAYTDVDSVSTATWYHFANVRSSTHETSYLQGTYKQDRDIDNGGDNTELHLGVGYNAFFDGRIDELRTSSNQMTSNWISTEYNNQNSPSTFYVTGGQETETQSINISESVSVQISTSGTLSVNVNDSITVSEDSTVLINYLNIDVNDSINITESTTPLINYLNVDVNDGLTVTEFVDARLTSYINVNDEVTVSEDVSVIRNLAVDVSDSITVTDVLPEYHPEEITVTESVSAEVQSAGNQLDIDVADSITITEDSTVLITTQYIDVSDSITTSEQVTVIRGSNVDVNDEITTSEFVDARLRSYINVNDEVTLTEDTTTLINQLYIDVNDEITITEGSTVRLTSYINQSDSITLTELVDVARDGARDVDVYEDLIVSESVTVSTTDNPQVDVSDEVTVTESSTVEVFTFIDTNDEITISEETPVSLTNYIDVNDEITLAEDTPVSLVNYIDVNDGLTITEDSTVLIPTLYIDTSEDITLTENITVVVNDAGSISVNASDTITVTEQTTTLINYLNINVADSITVTEDNQQVKGLNVTISPTFTLDDKTGNNDLTGVNNPTSSTDTQFSDSSYSLDLDRASSQSAVNSSPSGLPTSGDVTIEVGIKIDDLSAGSVIVALTGSSEDQADNQQWFVYVNTDGTIRISWEHGTGADVILTSSASQVTEGVWGYHTFVRDTANTDVLYYKNGSYVETFNYTNQADGGSNAELWVGGNATGGAGVDGQLDEIRIWDGLRNATEISDNYQVELTGNESGLVGYFPFEEGGADTITVTESVSVSIETPAIEIDVNDSVTITEDSTAKITSYINSVDNITITEDSTVSPSATSFDVDVSDDIAITDTSNIGTTSYIETSESIGVSEDITALVSNLSIDVADSIAVVEDSIAFVNYLTISVSDSVSIADEPNVGFKTLSINLSDIISISESIAMKFGGAWYRPDPQSWHSDGSASWHSKNSGDWKTKNSGDWYSDNSSGWKTKIDREP